MSDSERVVEAVRKECHRTHCHPDIVSWRIPVPLVTAMAALCEADERLRHQRQHPTQNWHVDNGVYLDQQKALDAYLEAKKGAGL